jgi:hypothetical protein
MMTNYSTEASPAIVLRLYKVVNSGISTPVKTFMAAPGGLSPGESADFAILYTK